MSFYVMNIPNNSKSSSNQIPNDSSSSLSANDPPNKKPPSVIFEVGFSDYVVKCNFLLSDFESTCFLLKFVICLSK